MGEERGRWRKGVREQSGVGGAGGDEGGETSQRGWRAEKDRELGSE